MKTQKKDNFIPISDEQLAMIERTEERKNRFNGEPALLPWFAVAVYDTLMGAEQLGDNKTLRQGLDWFQKYFTDQYYILLD